MIRDLPALRAALGVTTRELAAMLGIDVRTVQRYLDGSIAVPEPTWRLLNLVVSDPAVRASLQRMVAA